MPWSQFHALFAITLVAFLTTAGGLWIASRKPSWYTEDKLCALIALGTGLLIGVAFIEFLPISLASPSNGPLLVIAGLFFILFVETYIAPRLNFLEGQNCDHDHSKAHDLKHRKAHSHQHHFISHQAACSAVGCLIVCSFFDGLQMMAAFQIDAGTGWLVSLGLLFHVLPDGVLAAGIALAGGMSRKNAIWVSWITGIALVAGAGFSSALAKWAGGVEVVLPFAAGVLVYVTLIHLLPVGSRHRHGLKFITLGCAFFIIVHVLSGHTH